MKGVSLRPTLKWKTILSTNGCIDRENKSFNKAFRQLNWEQCWWVESREVIVHVLVSVFFGSRLQGIHLVNL